MADTPATGATEGAAETPAAAPRAVTNPLDSTRDSRIAQAKAMGRIPGAAPSAHKPKTPARAAASVAEGSESTSENASESATDGTETAAGADDSAETEAESDAETAETEAETLADGERVTAALAAIEKGDVEALAKALGADASKVPVPTKRAFRAIARREAKHKAALAAFDQAKSKAQGEIAAESNRVSQMQRGLGQQYAPAAEAQKAWDNQDALALGKALEKQFKTDLASLTQMLASGKSGRSKEEQSLADQRAAFEKEKNDFEAKKRGEESSKTVAQKREAAVQRVGKALESHPYVTALGADGKPSVDKEALEEVFAAYEKAWDPEKGIFTKTARKIADELQSKLEARAKSRGLVKGQADATATAPGKKPAAGKRPGSQRQPEPPRSGKNGSSPALDLEATRAMRIAQAKRMGEMQRRGMS